MSNLSRNLKAGSPTDLVLKSLQVNTATTLLAALIGGEEPTTIDAKIQLLSQLMCCAEELECNLENKTTFLHWTAITSGFATAAVICGTAALNPIAGFLVAATSASAGVVTIGGSILHNSHASKLIDKLKRLQLAIKSDALINWACLWELAGLDLFCTSLQEAGTGTLSEFELIKKGKVSPLTAAVKLVAQSGGVEVAVVVKQLGEIKSGVLKQLEENIFHKAKQVLQPAPQPIIEIPAEFVGATSTPEAKTDLNLDKQQYQNAWDILQALVTDADKSKLGGCVILAAPGAGKTTYLCTAWGRLKQTYGSRFNSLAIVVKDDDVEAFRGVSDNCLLVEDSPRSSAIAILKFIDSCKRQDGCIKRLFLDDFLTMNEIFKAALGGLFVNPTTFDVVLSKKEDIDAQPMLPTLYAALNKLWLVGRQNNAALWVSSHSSNVDALPFVGSRESRSVGDIIFLARNDKREFIEQAINNPNLIGDNTRRQEIKALLNSVEPEVEEPLVLANFNNWTFGIVSNEVYQEYQEFREEWEKVEPIVKPGEKLSDIIKGLEKSLEINDEKPKELFSEEIIMQVKSEVADIAKRLLSFFDNAKNKEPKSLADIKKKDELRKHGDIKLIMALTELVSKGQLLIDDKDSWSKSDW
jgi:hypothetical protein